MGSAIMVLVLKEKKEGDPIKRCSIHQSFTTGTWRGEKSMNFQAGYDG
ncbi:hypothetical protein BDA96_08G072900 [Sorghum bicolor]|uniref:Uncharacterized protein n=1 Tax=Sorghum bicolor TaxID=4558 RepID=A0A921U6C3_SORBI|nr:hypothetical protein BDA96_08G072900 [Sorghum bicolor]